MSRQSLFPALRAAVVGAAIRALASVGLSLLLAASWSAEAPAQAESTWPVLHGDPGNTDFVPLAGPRQLVPHWQALQVKAAAANVAVGPDGHLYTTTMDAGPCHLHALDADGNTLWCSAEVRWAFTFPVVAPDGTVFVTDGTEVFQFASDGTILWRVAATGRALGPIFSREGYLIIFDQLGWATAYDPSTGSVVAQLLIPSATNPRPVPLPAQSQFFKVGAPLAGWDPTAALLDAWIDAFNNYNTAVGNNIPAMDANGRMFIGVAKGPAPSTTGVFYGIDFTPPSVPGGLGAFSIACSRPMGLNSSTSPALSADGKRIYAGDAATPPQLRAFNADDCSQAWTLGLEAQSLASPTVDLDGRIFMNVNQKVFAFRDNETSATVLWQANLTPKAQALGFASARVNSVLPRAANYLYAGASFFNKVGTQDVPMAHVLATLDPSTGDILSLADLGEESDSTPSIGPNGQVYVPAKPIVKAINLGIPSVRPFVPPARSGIFAFEPASYQELTADGVNVALDFLNRSAAASDVGDTASASLEASRALRQVRAAKASLARAEERGEISNGTSSSVEAHLDWAERRLASDDINYAQVRQGLEQARDGLKDVPPNGGTLLRNQTIVHGGLTRYFDAYIPADLPPRAVPLLVTLHGGTQSKDALEYGPWARFKDLADREKFLIISPNGTTFTGGVVATGPTGKFNWNDCRNDAGPATTPADDVGFVSALIDWAKASYDVDEKRVYAAGASNGGMMSYRLALELSDRLAAVAALIAGLPANSECPSAPAQPISVLVMNGTVDPLMPWLGGPIASNNGVVLSGIETRDFWRTTLDVKKPTTTLFPDLDPTDGGQVQLEYYSGGTASSEVAFYTVNGGGHLTPSIQSPVPPVVQSVFGRQNHDIEAAEELWAFLSSQRH